MYAKLERSAVKRIQEEAALTHVITAGEGEIFDVELETNILNANRQIAEENKAVFVQHGIRAIDVMGAIGSGKTSLIGRVIERVRHRYRVAVVEGDVTTRIDADILSQLQVPVIPINTGKECHLDANLVKKALARLDLSSLDLLFVENVGNLICPAEFPLGSDKRLVVISVTEGPYMVLKHPMMFLQADIVAVNKIDLAQVMRVEPDKLRRDINSINPSAKVASVSCRTGEGVEAVISNLEL